MFSFHEFYLLKENFDNVLDFLLNPEHRNKTWSELMKEFESSGGSMIGVGKYGHVYSHPNWKYVLKTFVEDSHYLKFVRFAYKNPHPSFPKFFGTAQRIIPFFKRTKYMAKMYVIRMEKLNPITNTKMMKEIIDNYPSIINYFDAVKLGLADKTYEKEIIPNYSERKLGKPSTIVKEKIHKNILNLFEEYPQTRSLYEAIHLVMENIKESALDIHSGNIMQRNNGELVLIDPLWAGSNPYIDYANAINLEIGYEGPEDPEDVIGGKLPKNPRAKKKKQYAPSYTDIPF